MTIKTNFDDGLMDILKKMDAELVSIEVKGERLVKKFDRDDHALDDIEDFFEDFDGADAHVEYIGDERCFVCEVTTEGKDDGIVVITAEEPEKVKDAPVMTNGMIIPPSIFKTVEPTSAEGRRDRILHEERVAQGLCAGCGKRPPEPTLINGRPSRYCRQCQAQKRNAHDKQRLGLISSKESTPFSQLEIAVDISTKKTPVDYARERTAELKAKGICISCGKRKATKLKNGKQSVYCSVCRKRKNEAQNSRNAKKRAKT